MSIGTPLVSQGQHRLYCLSFGLLAAAGTNSSRAAAPVTRAVAAVGQQAAGAAVSSANSDQGLGSVRDAAITAANQAAAGVLQRGCWWVLAHWAGHTYEAGWNNA